MAMVGDKNSLNWMMTASAPANSASSAARMGTKSTAGSSNSSSDFATLFSPKKSSDKDSSPAASRKNFDPKRSGTKEEAVAQANFPGQPKSEFSDKIPSKLNNGVVSEARAQVERPGQQSVGVQARVEKRELDESVDNLAHRQAIQNLLKKMKEEFGLDAEQVVEAFSALTPQELMSPPEASLEKLIQALPLTPEQQAQAKMYFQQMLKDTASNDMADYLKTSQRQLSLEVVSKKEARDRAIQRAVEKMQSDFFTQPQVAQPQQPTVAVDKYKQAQGSSEKSAGGPVPFMANAMPNRAGLDSAGQMAEMTSMMNPMSPAEPVADGQPAQESQLNGAKPAINLAAGTAATATTLLTQDQISAPVEMSDAGDLGETFEVPDMFDLHADQALTGLDIPDAEIVSIKTAGDSSLGAAAAPEMTIAPMATASQTSGGGREEKRGHDEKAYAFNPPAPVGQRQGQPVNGLKGESFMVSTQPTPTQDAQNIKEVVSRAQMLATKGGGEMKIILAPEALGEVTMKVAVQNGQVNVEMIAESKEAKKLLEAGLGDLKATLLSNNLKVDQIRVDTPADVSRQLTQNHDEAQRQFAQQFMEQFRQENNDWRRGFYDIGGARPYRGQKEEAERGPSVGNGSDRRKESTRRLDLVA